jgi:protein TonB
MTFTLALHAVVLILGTLGWQLRIPPPDPEPAQVITVTFIGRESPRVAAPPPAPTPAAPTFVPPKPPQPPQPVAEQVVAVEDAEVPAATEVMQLPPLELPKVEDDAMPLASDVSAELAATAEGNPDMPPTERLAYRHSNPPHYPPEARETGDSGWVWVRVLVSEDGVPLDFVLDGRTTASSLLVDAAIAAIREWRFNPAMKGGEPVRAWIEVPIGFFAQSRKSASSCDEPGCARYRPGSGSGGRGDGG